MLTSSDGDHWEKNRITHSAGEAIDLWQLASSGKELVAASNVQDVVWTSKDGLSWIPRSTGCAGMIYKLNYSYGRFVGLASTGNGGSTSSVLLTSLDGITWVVSQLGDGRLSLHDVVWTGKHFVGVGMQAGVLSKLKVKLGLYSKLASPVTAVSDDGKSWSVTEFHSSKAGESASAIVWTGTNLLMYDRDGGIYISSDGVTWNQQANPPTDILLANVVSTGKQLVAVGRDESKGLHDSAAIFTSPDGHAWTKSMPVEGEASLSNVVWTGSQYVAVGPKGQIQTSLDGVAWTRKSPVGETDTLTKVISNGTMLVAVGMNAALTSSDGMRWFSHAVPVDFKVSSVAWNGNHFVAVGSKGVVFTSVDGEVWHAESSGTKEDLADVVWTGNQMICVGIDNTTARSSALILGSPDGTKWARRSVEGAVGGLCAVVSTGNNLVAVGHRGSVVTSRDGNVWTRQRGGEMLHGLEFPNLEGIAWSGKTYVAVGRAGCLSAAKAVLCSNDGITWTDYPGAGPNILYGVAWIGDRFIAVGERGVVHVSTDGFTWSYDSTVSWQSLIDAYWDGKSAYAVGTGGMIMSTTPGP
ncbi:MAG: hypothetical protein ABI600_11425 [Luteolibacter sp.]